LGSKFFLTVVRVIILGALLAFASIGSAAQNESFDFSCATFHAFLTEAELVARYGRENVTTEDVWI
jgi:hypothetical protein